MRMWCNGNIRAFQVLDPFDSQHPHLFFLKPKCLNSTRPTIHHCHLIALQRLRNRMQRKWFDFIRTRNNFENWDTPMLPIIIILSTAKHWASFNPRAFTARDFATMDLALSSPFSQEQNFLGRNKMIEYFFGLHLNSFSWRKWEPTPFVIQNTCGRTWISV